MMKKKLIKKKLFGGMLGGMLGGLTSMVSGTGGSSGTPSSPLGKASGIMGGIGVGADIVGSFLPPKSEYQGEQGAITQGMDAAYDGVADTLMSVPGWGCVCAGTKVFDKDGRCVNIEDLCQDDGIIGWTGDKIKAQTIAAFIEPHEKECVEITLQCGTKLRCSTDHPIYAACTREYKAKRINGLRFKFKIFDFYPAAKIPERFYVGLANGIDIWGKNKDGQGLADYIYYNDELPENPYDYTKEAICLALTILIDKLADIRFLAKDRNVKLIFKNVNKEVLEWIDAQFIKLGIYSLITDYQRLDKRSFNIKNRMSVVNLCESLDLFYSQNIKKLLYAYKIMKELKCRNTAKYNGIIDSQIVSIKPIGKQIIYNLQADTDHTYLANGIITHNTIAGGAMKANAMLGKAMNALGGGTDGETTVDAILGSSFLGLDPISLINGFGGKKADTFSKDLQTFSQIGSSYGGSDAQADYALSKSGKKFGLFSSAARERANAQIAEAKRQQGIMADIAETANKQNDLLATMSDRLSNNRRLKLNGGYQQGTIHAAKNGMRLFFSDAMIEKANRVLKHQSGGIIQDDTIVDNIEADTTDISNNEEREQFEEFIKSIDFQKPELLEKLDSLDDEDVKERFFEYWKRNGKPLTFEDAIENGFIIDNDGEFDFKEEDYELQTLSDNEEEPTKENNEETEKEEIDENNPEKFQNGGQMSVIPDGSLHARKHDIEKQAEETNPDLDLKGNITHKGIPVVAIEENGKVELLAEVEKEELILSKECTDLVEDLRQRYHSAESLKEKDEIAEEAGKIIVYELQNNLDDRAGLMEKVEE